MDDRTRPASAEPSESLFGAMPDVVKGLKDQPPLLFGIGAGIVLVAVLAATTSVGLVLIVAGVLVLALAAWVVNEAAARRRPAPDTQRGGIQTIVGAEEARIRGSDVGTVDDSTTGDVRVDVQVPRANISDSSVGQVGSGSSPRRRRRT